MQNFECTRCEAAFELGSICGLEHAKEIFLVWLW